MAMKDSDSIEVQIGSWIRILAGTHIGRRGKVIEVNPDGITVLINHHGIHEATLRPNEVRPTAGGGASLTRWVGQLPGRSRSPKGGNQTGATASNSGAGKML